MSLASEIKYKSQKGAVLLIFMLVIILGSSFMLTRKFNGQHHENARTVETLQSLAKAKEALIAYAVTYYEDNPGEFAFLPCPDANPLIGNEGSQDPNCGAKNVNVLGRFPWGSLKIPRLYDGNGDCLWYAVSGSYKNNPKTDMLNEDSRGAFRVFRKDGITLLTGDNPEDRVVALLISPGSAIASQDRTSLAANVVQCGGNYVAGNYLDSQGAVDNAVVSGVADTVDSFVTFSDITSSGYDGDNDGTVDGNDIIITITLNELFNAVKKRNDYEAILYDNRAANNLTERIAECLANYNLTNRNNDEGADGLYNRSMPWPAPLDLVDYRNDAEYDDRGPGGVSLAGRLPIIITDSNDAIYNDCGAPVANCTRPVDNNLMSYCERFWTTAVGAAQAAELKTLWGQWKDHLFYAVSEQYQPQPRATDIPGQLFTAGGSQDWSAIVFFSGEALGALNQSRNSTPLDDIDEKNDISNYLEDENLHNYEVGGDSSQSYNSAPTTATFNDILYCVQDSDDNDGVNAFEAAICPQ